MKLDRGVDVLSNCAMDSPNPAIMHPPPDMPMLSWWRGIYDHVFIALHPFYGVRRADEEGREELLNWNQRPPEYDFRVKGQGEMVRWTEAHRQAVPEVSREAVNLAIWLMACSGYVKRADIALQERLVAWAEGARLYFPQDDGMPSILEPTIGCFFTDLGAHEVRAFDEFRDHSTVFPVGAFAADQPPLRMPQYATSSAVWGLHLSDPGVLITWDFDGAEALIAMTSRSLSLVRPEDYFDGWYADETTYADVFNPKDFLPRQT